MDQAAAPPAAPVVDAPSERDWLSTICPYLQSEDGTYRSDEPDAGHRCTAQDPPGTLPLAFQERFCLTDRHPRCEMYKYAQEAAGLPAGPVDHGLEAATPPPTGPAPATSSTPGDGEPRRPALVVAAGIAALTVFVFAFALLMSSCSGEETAPGEEPSADPMATEAATTEPLPTPEPTVAATREPAATAEPGGGADATEPPVTAQLEILYEIQGDEALLKVAETFGVTRRRILRFNPGLEETAPAELPGQVIVIPVPPEMSIEEVEALPGYKGLAP